MRQLLQDIIDTAYSYTENFKEYGNYDYSIESLEMVDQHIQEMGQYDLNEEMIYNICSMVGCYIFETTRKNYGGKYYWIKKEEQPVLVAGEPDFTVSMKAWEKVKDRLLNGEEDNIPFYIAGYKEHVNIGLNKKGYTVTIV
jgi:hypothetical protein